MADAAAATEQNEARRLQILTAAAELIAENGVAETRIADVAKRAKVSSSRSARRLRVVAAVSRPRAVSPGRRAGG